MLAPDPGARTPLSRRRVLVDGGRGLLALALLGTSTAACGHGGPPEPDPLEALLSAARHDSDLAARAAKAAPRQLVPALLVVADERARHAAALVEELARAAGKPTPTADPAAPTTTGGSPDAKPAPPPSVRDVLDALRASADSAAKLAPTLSGYRAGLVGSIAAACTASHTVGLPSAPPPPPPPPPPGKGAR